MATSENLKGSRLLQITLNPQLDNIESDFHVKCIGKPVVSVCYYHLPFFSNVATQVDNYDDHDDNDICDDDDETTHVMPYLGPLEGRHQPDYVRTVQCCQKLHLPPGCLPLPPATSPGQTIYL